MPRASYAKMLEINPISTSRRTPRTTSGDRRHPAGSRLPPAMAILTVHSFVSRAIQSMLRPSVAGISREDVSHVRLSRVPTKVARIATLSRGGALASFTHGGELQCPVSGLVCWPAALACGRLRARAHRGVAARPPRPACEPATTARSPSRPIPQGRRCIRRRPLCPASRRSRFPRSPPTIIVRVVKDGFLENSRLVRVTSGKAEAVHCVRRREPVRRHRPALAARIVVIEGEDAVSSSSRRPRSARSSRCEIATTLPVADASVLFTIGGGGGRRSPVAHQP